jgi:hypothetical protein
LLLAPHRDARSAAGEGLHPRGLHRSEEQKETAMFQDKTKKKMFKIISPIDKRDGSKFWMRCGVGYENKDQSVNMYIDALPVAAGKDGRPLTLQLREVTEEELRERSEKRGSSYSSRGTLGRPSMFEPPDPNHVPMIPGAGGLDHAALRALEEPPPF